VRQLPTGTVTFLFTDIEGSTQLLRELGDAYADVLAEHRRLVREAFGRHGGVEVDTQGDAFFVAFARAHDALRAAGEAQRLLATGPVRVRMGVHTGEPLVTDEGYVGIDVHRAARVMAAGHGGQVLVSAATRTLADEQFALRDLGSHRLKDLTEPQHLYQLGDAQFPPPKSLNQTNLPVAASPLVGRAEELGELMRLLRDGVRVVTVTGPGGSGKTRLALQAAAELVEEYADGTFWVPLAGLRDPALVLPSVAQTIGATDDLSAHLATRETLILLDNFEHLLDASALVAELLASAPRAQVLVTSRAPLNIDGEREYSLDPLLEREAVMLFVERARDVGRLVEPDETLAEICRRLDCLPLALELAAARTKLLAPEPLLRKLAQRLPLLTGGRRDAPERQRTLRATIAWSHDLLDEQSRLVFARLSVFAGTFSLDAAEKVTAADLDALAALVELSLLKPVGEERFLMLETIREFAAERLEADQTAGLQRAHAEWFLALAEAAEPHLRGTEFPATLDRLEREHDNLRAAFDYFEVQGESESALRLAGAMFRFWFSRGYGGEARKRLGYVLRADTAATELRAKALSAAATLALDDADPQSAKVYAEEARAIYRDLGATANVGYAYATVKLAQAASDSGDARAARDLAEENLRLVRKAGDDYVRAAMHELGWMTFLAGDVDSARTIHELNLVRSREARDRFYEAASLELLALIAISERRIAAALELLRESYAINRELAYSFGIAFDLDYLAAATAAEGRPEVAAQLFGRAEALRDEIGVRVRPADAAINEQTLSILRTELGEDGLSAAMNGGRSLTLEEAVALALGP
jgi:predicted ATPase/class 3 adenylate cyclase